MTEEPPVQAWFGLVLRQSEPEAADEGADDKGFIAVAAKTLAAGSAVLTALIAAVGTVDGGLNRLLLNSDWEALLCIFGMLAGVVLAFLAAANVKRDWRVGFVISGFVFFVLGLVGLSVVEALTIGANERPAISTAAKIAADGSSLEGTVTAGGLESDQWVYVVISGVNLQPSEGKAGARVKEDPSRLYETRAGPDRSGKVNATFNVAGIFGRFDFIRVGATLAKERKDEGVNACFIGTGKPRTEQSCATIYPPRTRERPVLNVSWEMPLTGSNLLSIGVKSSVIDPDDVVLLDVSDAKEGRIVYRTMFSPTSAGGVDASAKVAVPFPVKRVCVAGQTISAADVSALKAQPRIRTCKVDSFDLTRTSFAIAVAPERDPL